MNSRINWAAPLLFVVCCGYWSSSAHAQFAGSRGGVQTGSDGLALAEALRPDEVKSHIVIEGSAELRVKPNQMRIVLAALSDSEDAASCQDASREKIGQLRQAWEQAGIGDSQIYEDFIAILPRYRWEIEQQNDQEVGVEKLIGYRMQSNLHISVPGDAEARTVLQHAFAQGITEVIAFDYGHDGLDQKKLEAQQAAMKAALAKADALLGSLFDQRPAVINVQEQTTVRYPEALYQSFTNTVDEAVVPTWRRDIPFFRAARPQNTYYRGQMAYTDVTTGGLPMSPEISVVSSVRVYFRAPGDPSDESE